MNKKDMFIKDKLQQDKYISERANNIFENLKEEFVMDNKDRKIIKVNFNKYLSVAASFVLVLFVATNLYAHSVGKPNIFTAIRNLFNIDKEDYNAAEEDINITVESNGVKLTLKTAAMDDNVLIVKYVAEGEKLAKEFYTYQDFEEELIKINKIRFKLAGTDIETDEYDSYTLKDITKTRQEIVEKLKELGLTEEDAKELEQIGTEAYKEYVGVQLATPEYSEEDAKIQIEKTIAMFESNVNNKISIITSEDKLSEYKINAIAQSIEKEENKYIIHAIYNVDTISDLANNFTLYLDVDRIGEIKGEWVFGTELEKSRLDNRVETINFYGNEANVYGNDEEGYIKVAIKKLVISDFSSVLMVQKDSENYQYNDEEALEKHTFTYIVTDEQDNVLGTSGTKKKEIVYADRIILEDVDINTKVLKIKVYSNIDNKLLDTITINIEEARQENHIILNQTLYNEYHGISLKYPGDWTQGEKQYLGQGVNLYSQKDVDGNEAWISMERILLKDIGDGKIILDKPEEKEDVIKNTITIGGYTGDDYVYSYLKDGSIKERQIRIIKDNAMYYIRFRASDTQFERYYEIFEEILKTVNFREVELEEEVVEEENKPSNEIEEENKPSNEIEEENKPSNEIEVNNYPTTNGSIFEYSIDTINENVKNKKDDIKYLEPICESNSYAISQDRTFIKIHGKTLDFDKEIYHACVYPIGQGSSEMWAILFRDGTVKYTTDGGNTIRVVDFDHVIDMFPITYERETELGMMTEATILVVNEYGAMMDLFQIKYV